MRKMKWVSWALMAGLLLAFLLMSTAAPAQESGGEVAYGAVTAGRLRASMAAVAGLVSAILGGVSLLRSAGRFGAGTGRRGAILAGGLGLTVLAYAVLHLTMFTGALGTGSGRAGAVVALALGLTAMVLAGFTLARSARTA